jgi:hypothetical protein
VTCNQYTQHCLWLATMDSEYAARAASWYSRKLNEPSILAEYERRAASNGKNDHASRIAGNRIL